MQLWGCITAWYGRYMVVYSSHNALFMMSFSLGIVLFVWLTGFLCDDYTPDATLYITVVGSFAILVIIITFHFVASSNRKDLTLVDVEKDIEIEDDCVESAEESKNKCQTPASVVSNTRL